MPTLNARDSDTSVEPGDDTLWARWRLPKVELHNHLQGTLRPDTVSDLARRHEPGSPFCQPGWGADYYRIALECFDDLAAQNVVYAEVCFSPRAPSMPHYALFSDMTSAISQARREVEACANIRIGLIVGINWKLERQSADDPLAFGASITAELGQFTVQAAKHSLLPITERRALEDQLRAAWAKHWDDDGKPSRLLHAISMDQTAPPKPSAIMLRVKLLANYSVAQLADDRAQWETGCG